MITEMQLIKLRRMIANGTSDVFYSCSHWIKLREKVLELDRRECQLCKAKGRYRKAVIVHHVKHLKDRPDLALSIYDGEERQLVSVCKECHEEQHPESMRQYKYTKAEEPLTEERWD